MMCDMTRRTPYTPGRIQELGPIAGLTRDQSSGPNADLVLQGTILGHSINIPIGDSASAPTVIDINWP